MHLRKVTSKVMELKLKMVQILIYCYRITFRALKTVFISQILMEINWFQIHLVP